MLIEDLPQKDRLVLATIQEDVSHLYSLLSQQYMVKWDKYCSNEIDKILPPTVRHVMEVTKQLNIRQHSKFIHVESDYYQWPLQQRAFRVNAPSQEHMCKSIILENTRCTHNDISDPLYSRYYCVITQYTQPVNTQKLLNYGRSLKNKEISKKYYNYRLADPEVSLKLTGFEEGGVSPIGMNKPIPVIMAESITKLKWNPLIV
ncbi:hypothetical protein BDB01DRAFT_468314 [Pilobolus umbonatus]|nr:hypothetical protein BDB01DRAFT_468314 [Pilobolus umbonatus]